ncbi:MAG: terpene cyclase/mutase family protein [Verrucomicrobia bacterium]|nr:terpene cyclase/mutase family protein [Verrucomicrobiota bacterium]MDA1087167.1 terpene cyclase/mutase family protein [Verrucomicrobiota bacterium]
MEIKYTPPNEEDLMRLHGRERILDAKSVIIGTALFVLLIGGAAVWRLATGDHLLKPLKEFEFTPDAPDTEDFELKDPQRELIEERMLEEPEDLQEIEHTPNVQMTTEITESTIVEEVIDTESIEMTTDVDIDITEMDIIDAPEEVVDLSEATAYAVTPIAAVSAAPADLFKFDRPNPRDRPQLSMINTAPRPSKGLKLMPRQFGELDAPTIGELGPMNISLLGDGEYLSAMGRSGGFEQRTAVNAALRWLAIHQEPEGYWEPHKWDPEDISFDNPEGYEGERGDAGRGSRTAITGLSIIAMMGGGHSVRRGEYRAHVARALEWLITQQDEKTGRISDNLYMQSICTIALCEAFGRSPNERLGAAARKAVDFCVQAVGQDDGWRYAPKPAMGDMSVTGWVMQALKSAKLANIKFDYGVFARGLTYIDQLTDKGGAADSAGGVGYTAVADLAYGEGSRPLTCAAMVIRQFSGMGVRAPLLVKGAELTRGAPPSWEEEKDFYYWYYATYAMHNMGGEYRIWWNRRMRDVLLDNQSRRGHQAGSWDPEGSSFNAGRVYSTSLGALCMEVYYRYGEALQSFGTAPELEDMFFQ